MRARARLVDPAAAPAALRLDLGQPLVTPGKEYEVHAAAVFDGLVFVLVVNDLGCPTWRTTWLFDVVDAATPADWICSTFHDDPSLILGPEFIAGSREGYAAIAELEPEQIARFWKRAEERRDQES